MSVGLFIHHWLHRRKLRRVLVQEAAHHCAVDGVAEQHVRDAGGGDGEDGLCCCEFHCACLLCVGGCGVVGGERWRCED